MFFLFRGKLPVVSMRQGNYWVTVSLANIGSKFSTENGMEIFALTLIVLVKTWLYRLSFGLSSCKKILTFNFPGDALEVV